MNCDRCEREIEEESHSFCVECEKSVCDDCINICSYCDNSICVDCSINCYLCEYNFCSTDCSNSHDCTNDEQPTEIRECSYCNKRENAFVCEEKINGIYCRKVICNNCYETKANKDFVCKEHKIDYNSMFEEVN